nr:hypothetical protein [uncultured Mediterraneibacter sp.]
MSITPLIGMEDALKYPITTQFPQSYIFYVNSTKPGQQKTE